MATWGDPDRGGDSSQVRELVRVQQVQATASALAVLDDGFVTWGTADAGGDSSQVQKQLTGFQQIHSTSRAFAAILSDGSVVRGEPDAGGDAKVQTELHML